GRASGRRRRRPTPAHGDNNLSEVRAYLAKCIRNRQPRRVVSVSRVGVREEAGRIGLGRGAVTKVQGIGIDRATCPGWFERAGTVKINGKRRGSRHGSS